MNSIPPQAGTVKTLRTADRIRMAYATLVEALGEKGFDFSTEAIVLTAILQYLQERDK